MSNSNQTNSTPSSETTPAPASPKPKGGRQRDPLPLIVNLVQPNGDGWSARQFNDIKINMDVHNMLAAVRELQDNYNLLAKRVNGCKDC